MAKIRVQLTFPSERVKDPIIYEIGHEFKVVTNIRKANVTESEGWMVLELNGESDEIEGAIRALEERGVRVDPVEGNVME